MTDVVRIYVQIVLLESELEDVLVNAVNAIRVLSTSNSANQTEVAEKGAIEPLVEFLSANDSGESNYQSVIQRSSQTLYKHGVSSVGLIISLSCLVNIHVLECEV